MLRVLLLFSFFSIISSVNAQVIINEVCPGNELVADVYGETPDWIEIKNTGNESINLNNYFLSDDPLNIYKWQFPLYILSPGELVVFFSELSYSDSEHITFGFSNDGETILLSKNLEGIVQALELPEVRLNNSYGKDPVADDYYFYGELTPDEENNAPPKTGYSEEILFEPEGGLYFEDIYVDLTNLCSNGVMHFTFDGSFPTEANEVISDGFDVTETVVTKAICVQENKLPSYVETDTYLMNNYSKLPVIAISLPEDTLFHPELGIYMLGPDADDEWPYFGANYWKDKHVKSTLEYFRDDERLIKQEVDLKIHGGKSSRNKAQRPLRITARDKYGQEFIPLTLFEEKPQEEFFKHLILRNSGADFLISNFRDGYWHQLVLEEGLDFDVFGFQPAVVLINGQYWGIMNIRERVSEYFIAQSNTIEPDSILIGEKENEQVRGDTIHFYNFKELAINSDLSLEENYNVIQDQLDIGSYMDYFSTEIFAGNLDWPANNIKYWKPSPTQGKWKYIMFDLDTTMELFEFIPFDVDMFDFIYDSKSWSMNSKIFMSLMENTEFKRSFLNRLADLMNTSFTEENLLSVLNDIVNEMAPEINQHYSRWGGDIERYNFEVDQRIPEFFSVRGDHVKEHAISHFGLDHTVQINFEVYPKNAGEIQINTISPSLPFTGDYFSGNAIDVSVTPFENMTFLRWDYSTDTIRQSTDLGFQKDFNTSGTLTAVFEDDSSEDFFLINTLIQSNQLEAIFNSTTSGLATMDVYNVNGRLVHSAREIIETGKNKINVTCPDLSSGLYVVRAQLNDESHTAKFVMP
ncbi:MAG: CotH kinase family protein [Flavobacteriales bacterium]